MHPLYICAYFKPKADDQESLLELRRSVEEVKKHAKGNIWILRDFILPKLIWTYNIPTLKPDCTWKPIYDIFFGLIELF